MKKEKFHGLMWIIVGTFIGAGFVSGKEIYNYFSRFGFLLIVMVFLSIMLFYFFVQLLSNKGEDSGYFGYCISAKMPLKGVYNINKGYTVFRKVDILESSNGYSIVKKNSVYGLSTYDHIVLDASVIGDGQLIYR